MYTWRVFEISLSVSEATVISIICEGLLFSSHQPDSWLDALDSRLVFDPESSIARTSTNFPFLARTLTFCTGHNPVTGLNLFFWYTALPWMLPFHVADGPWNWLWNGAAFGFKLFFCAETDGGFLTFVAGWTIWFLAIICVMRSQTLATSPMLLNNLPLLINC